MLRADVLLMVTFAEALTPVLATAVAVTTTFPVCAGAVNKPVVEIQVLGSDQKPKWKQEDDVLSIQPLAQWPSKHAVSFRIKTAGE